jgi:hypothetical protein
MQVLVGPTSVFDEHFLGSAAAVAYAVAPGCGGCAVEVSHVSDGIDCTASQVERPERPTSATVAHRSATTAGEHEYRMASQEADDVLTGVLAETSQDVEFTCRSSTQLAVQLVTPSGLLTGLRHDRYHLDRHSA